MRSKFEQYVADNLKNRHIKALYEPFGIDYVEEHSYIPDFVLPNGMIIEVKGYFDADSRSKMTKIREQYPELRIGLLFQRANNKINKNSSTTYADWAEKHGFDWAEGTIPDAWLKYNAQLSILVGGKDEKQSKKVK